MEPCLGSTAVQRGVWKQVMESAYSVVIFYPVPWGVVENRGNLHPYNRPTIKTGKSIVRKNERKFMIRILGIENDKYNSCIREQIRETKKRKEKKNIQYTELKILDQMV